MVDRPQKRGRAPKPAKQRDEPRTAEPAPEDQADAEAEQTFIESLITSGQAARPDKQGRLPPGATHEIVETKEGEIKVVRRRFSAY